MRSSCPRLRGEVSFEKVSFSYTPAIPVLRDVSMRLHPGESVALVGPTGAGKTTLVSLLSRLYDVGEGRINGGRARCAGRGQGVADPAGERGSPRSPSCSPGTVRDNIRFSRPEASDKDVVEAAKVVGAHEFISLLEAGYEAPVEERGLNFSPGQRQPDLPGPGTGGGPPDSHP